MALVSLMTEPEMAQGLTTALMKYIGVLNEPLRVFEPTLSWFTTPLTLRPMLVFPCVPTPLITFPTTVQLSRSWLFVQKS